MNQVTARLPDGLSEALGVTAARLRRSRAEIVRQALEHYLEDLEDLAVATERLGDPDDPFLDWEQVKRG